MLKRPRSDFWQVGVLQAPIESITSTDALAQHREQATWLPDPGPWRYLADPFAVQRDGNTHVFVEAYDYRSKHAVIEHHELGPDLAWRGKSVALSRPFHLSYPFLIEHQGETFMVPESHQAGEIALYRARRFPNDWVREKALLPHTPGAESSLLFHQGKWWMFFTIVGAAARDQRELHIASADELTGTWTQHPSNPVLIDRSGARPGGTPFVGADGCVHLPVQDCSETYGGALRMLRFSTLNEREVVCAHTPLRLTGSLVSATHGAGLHTLAQCGGLTLLDVKRVDHSRERQWIDLQRRWRRLRGTPYVIRPPESRLGTST